MVRSTLGYVVVGMVCLGLLVSPCSVKAEESQLSPESKASVENTLKLLSKIMEDSILKASAKAVELLPEVSKKTDEELNKIMDKAVRDITLEILKKEKFEEAVIEAVSKCAEEAFKKGVEDAMKEGAKKDAAPADKKQ